MQKIVIIGNLGGAAEIKQTQSGKQYASFSVAVSEKRGDTTNTTWYSCSIWNEKQVASLTPYLNTGTKVYVEGMPSANSWMSSTGEPRATINVMVNFIELLSSGQQQPQQPAVQDMSHLTPRMDPIVPAGANTGDVDDDDLPF